ncbi:MAG: hypothetical protein AAGL98_00505 [Planctomycetota bacterium]
MSIPRKFPSRFTYRLVIAAAGSAGLVGCEIIAPRPVNQPKLMSVEVATMDEPDPAAPMIEHMEVKAVRTGRATQTLYSVNLRGTIARPAGLENAFGPTGWAALEAVDPDGLPLTFSTRGYLNADQLHQEPADELYRRLGVSMSRHPGRRLPFDVQLNELEYLTPSFKKLSLRAYAVIPENPQTVELVPPALDASAAVAEAWTLRIETTADDRQELVLHALDADPAVWPLGVDLLDGQGNLLSAGYRRGVETRGSTLATQWKFNQPDILGSDAPGMDSESSAAPAAPGRRLRVRLADDLKLKQLDAELGDVQLIELSGKQP